MKKSLIVLAISVLSLYGETYTKALNNTGWHSVGVPITDVNVTETTFGDGISVVWQWDSVTQNWKFYSKSATLLSVANDLNVPIISTLTKGDAIWVKNSVNSSINFANSITPSATGCTESPQEVDTRVVKVGSSGQVLSDESTGWSAIWYKDPGLNVMLAFERTPATFLSTKAQTEAKTYCDNLTFIGFDNWRLPTREESAAMSYYYTENAAKIKNKTDNRLWSSSSSSSSSYYYYYQNISDYSIDSYYYTHKFQCVRTAQ